jgi:hypothetical protein
MIKVNDIMQDFAMVIIFKCFLLPSWISLFCVSLAIFLTSCGKFALVREDAHYKVFNEGSPVS